MQKKFIALAVAGLVSGAAFAQSNVTIYGIADAAFVSASGDRNGTQSGNANLNGINSGVLSGSRIGFKGEEGLGNGLKTIFTLEYGLAIDTNTGIGTGTSASRQTFVGLSSAKLGTVALGRQDSTGKNASDRADSVAASSTLSPLQILATASGTTMASNAKGRINNSVTYTSPYFSGFTAKGIYGYGESGGSTADGISQGNNGLFGAGLNYVNGPMNIDLAYESTRGRTTASPVTGIAASAGIRLVTAGASTQDNVSEWMLAGSYDFKVVKLYASYQDLNDNNGTSAQDASNKLWSIGATVPVFTNGTVHLAYADLSWDRSGAGGSDSWALGYTHAMSKRTTLYTAYIYTDNDANALVAAGTSGVRFIGESNGTFAAGIRHAF